MSSSSIQVHNEASVADVLLPVAVDQVRELLLPLVAHTVALFVIGELLGVVGAPAVSLLEVPKQL